MLNPDPRQKPHRDEAQPVPRRMSAAIRTRRSLAVDGSTGRASRTPSTNNVSRTLADQAARAIGLPWTATSPHRQPSSQLVPERYGSAALVPNAAMTWSRRSFVTHVTQNTKRLHVGERSVHTMSGFQLPRPAAIPPSDAASAEAHPL